jgi:serine phosphatase RsbU (regulator of sigma subunit)/CHASE3 domain sensor protein
MRPIAGPLPRAVEVSTMASRTGAGRILLGATVLSIAIFVAAFIVCAVLLRSAVVHAFAEQDSLHRSDAQRSLVFRLQLDEETGLRGFSLTRNRNFLEPFQRARSQMPAALRGLFADLRATDPAALPLARRERRIDARWNALMHPIIASPRLDTVALEIRGKGLVDRFRAQSDALAVSLQRIARDAGRGANLLVSRIVLVSFGLGALLIAALGFYVFAQSRMLYDLRKSHEAYERERNISQFLQDAFLLEPLPRAQNLLFDVAYATSHEAARVGGDWYGVVKLADGRFFVSVGDVAGHGVQAAVTMARARQTLLASAAHESSPAASLAKANDVLRLRAETLVTAFCGFIDPESRTLTYACAGHPPPLLLCASGESIYLDCKGTALGVMAHPHAVDFTREIQPGSTLICYTDGLLEFDRDLALGERRLREVARTLAHAHVDRPARTLLRRTLKNAKPRDDIAILIVTFLPDAVAPERTTESIVEGRS